MNLISKTSVPEVPAEQKAFDQAHKHLCKLRWIGQRSIPNTCSRCCGQWGSLRSRASNRASLSGRYRLKT
jgi:hypothetical protein